MKTLTPLYDYCYNGAMEDAMTRNDEGRKALEYLDWLLDKRGGGLEQSEVAERMGTKQSVVSRYHAMLGTSDLPTLTISRLIRYVYLERRQELNSPPDVDLPADAPPASQDSPGQA